MCDAKQAGKGIKIAQAGSISIQRAQWRNDGDGDGDD